MVVTLLLVLRIGASVQGSQPKNRPEKPLPFRAYMKPFDHRQRHAQNEQVEGYVRGVLDNIEYWKVDRRPFGAPITRDRFVLEERHEEEGNDPGSQNGEDAVGAACESGCDEDPLVEEDNGHFDAKDREAVEELCDEQDLQKA